jgi:hypothetical protein
MSRLCVLLALPSLLFFALASCTGERPSAPVQSLPHAEATPSETDAVPLPRELPARSPDQALAAGVAYLLEAQSPDGSWRSDVYATFKDGLALTPLVLRALQDAAAAGVDPLGSGPARRKGIEFLARLVKPDGTIDPGPDGIDYPIYTASLTLKALTHPDGKAFATARNTWIDYIKARQLTEKLGWKENEKQFGGWGYCRVVPRKPEPNTFAPPLIESNLSATVFALDALRSAGVTDPTIYEKAAIFVRRCQNVRAEGSDVLDGGFHFIYDDPTRNKAGGSKGSTDQQRFYSYGSTTADGVRALAYCGFPTDEPRRAEAADWLSKNFRPDTHPGRYISPHEPNREAVYFYYAASVTRALHDKLFVLAGNRDGARELAQALARRQNRDGSWINPVELVRENDPLVATSNAVSALSTCLRKP